MDYELAKQLKDAGFPLSFDQAGSRRHFTLEHKMGRFNGWQAGLGSIWTEKRHSMPTEAVARLCYRTRWGMAVNGN
jgi:hypothetical protein